MLSDIMSYLLLATESIMQGYEALRSIPFEAEGWQRVATNRVIDIIQHEFRVLHSVFIARYHQQHTTNPKTI